MVQMAFKDPLKEQVELGGGKAFRQASRSLAHSIITVCPVNTPRVAGIPRDLLFHRATHMIRLAVEGVTHLFSSRPVLSL